MKKLLDWANDCIRRWDWKNVALLKFCLLSIGLIVGMQVPKEKRKVVCAAAAAVFLAAYIPLMAKLFRLWTKKSEEPYEH